MRQLAGGHPWRTGLLVLLVPLIALWLVKLVTLHHSEHGHRQYWSQPRGQAGGLTYVALGDSAAQGIGASRPERGYVGLLAQRLRDATGQPVEVVNLSVSGARIGDLLAEQVPRLRELEPDVVTVAVGGNDVRGYERATFAQQVEQLVRVLPEGTLVADVPYYMHGRWQRDAQEAADTLTERARAQGLDVVPLHEALRAQGWSAMLTQFAADWFHPNDRGHRVWADAFWRVMEDSAVVTGAEPG